MEHSAKTAKRLQEINRWLDLQGDMGIEEEEEKPSLKWIIAETVARLPDDVYQQLVRFPKGPHLFFVGCGPGQRGQAIRKYFTVPPGFADRFAEDLIVLSNELCNMPIEEACGTVAHEIAHVLLGHMGLDPLEGYERKEGDVDRLVTAWGFELSKRPPD